MKKLTLELRAHYCARFFLVITFLNLSCRFCDLVFNRIIIYLESDKNASERNELIQRGKKTVVRQSAERILPLSNKFYSTVNYNRLAVFE